MAKTSGGDLPDETSEIFFAGGLDTNFAKQPVGQISLVLRPSRRNPALLCANAGPQAIDSVTRLSSRVEFPEPEFK
jgi:hypothetical protein